MDMYADDLLVILEYRKWNDLENKANVKSILQAMEKFRERSGLKINLGSTYLTIFGRQFEKPKFVDELKIKWCVEFKLLGIYSNFTLSKMYINYDRVIDSTRRKINLWKFRFLTIFGKVTFIKTMCIPKLNLDTPVVPSPSCVHLRSLELELKHFIANNNPNVVDDKTRKMTLKDGGFGIPSINTFWKAIRMSWLRR